MKPNIKITARQIRFLFDDGNVWMIQPLHVPDGVSLELRGYYSVPLHEQQDGGWGRLAGSREEQILRQWVSKGFKQ